MVVVEGSRPGFFRSQVEARPVRADPVAEDPWLSELMRQQPALFLTGDRISGIDPVAAVFTAANSESLSLASNARMQMGDIDMAGVARVNLTTTPGAGAQFHLVGKWDTTSTALQEWALVVNNTAGTIRFRFQVRDTGDTATGTVTANTFGAPATATWYTIYFYHDSVNNLLGIAVNDGVVDTAAWASGIRSSTSQFRIGSTADGANFANATMEKVGIWKRVLAAAEVTLLHNSNVGRFYSQLAASTKVALQAYWPLSEVSSTRKDSHNDSHTLTDNNTVTAVAGLGTPGLSDRGVVSTWPDLSGNANHATQATFANTFAYRYAGTGGLPDLLVYDTASRMQLSTVVSKLDATFVLCVSVDTFAQRGYVFSSNTSDYAVFANAVSGKIGLDIIAAVGVITANTSLIVGTPTIVVVVANRSSGAALVYINGVLDATAALNNDPTVTQTPIIGGSGGGGAPYSAVGSAAVLMKFYRGLTASQINATTRYINRMRRVY